MERRFARPRSAATIIVLACLAAPAVADPPDADDSVVLLSEILVDPTHVGAPITDFDQDASVAVRYLRDLTRRISLGAQAGRKEFSETVEISREPDGHREWTVTSASGVLRADLFPGNRVRPHGLVSLGVARIDYEYRNSLPYASDPDPADDGMQLDASLGAGLDVRLGGHFIAGIEVGYSWIGVELRESGLHAVLGAAW